MSSNKRLALTKDGKLTYCRSSPENFGKGRCNHMFHQEDNQTSEQFSNSLCYSEENGYYMINRTPESTEISSDKRSANKGSILNDSDYDLIKKSLPSVHTDDNGTLVMSSNQLETGARGLQHKGPIILSENNDEVMKFVKLDAINPKSKYHFKDYLDYNYSSISEDISSCFIRSLEGIDNFNSVLYSFQVANRNGEYTTLCLSDNYLYNSDGSKIYEKILSIDEGKRTIADDIRVDHDNFLSNVTDTNDNNRIFDSMVKYFMRYEVDENEVRSFILNQAAFDMITCNYDRKPNATNFMFLKNTSTNKTIPLNADYGRCLVMDLDTKTYKEKLMNYELEKGETRESFVNDTASFYKDTYFGEGSIFGTKLSSDSDIRRSVDFLIDNGFEGFRINKDKFERDLNRLIEKTERYNKGELKLFTGIKVSMFKQLLEHKEINRLWKEV